MGAKSVTKSEVVEGKPKVQALAEALTATIKRTIEVTIGRVRGAREIELERAVEVNCEESEDPATVALEVAEIALAHAIEAADGKRARFVFHAWGQAPPNQRDAKGVALRPELAKHEIAISADDELDDPLPSARAEAALVTREARGLIKDVGGEFVKLLKEINGLVAVVGETTRAAVAANADVDGKRWEFEKHKIDTDYRREERAAEIWAQNERNRNAHKTWRDLGMAYAPTFEALITLMGGVVPESAQPTEDEIRIVFSGQPALSNLALDLVRKENRANRPQIALAFMAAWSNLAEHEQRAVVQKAMAELSKERAIMISAWMRGITNEAKRAAEAA